MKRGPFLPVPLSLRRPLLAGFCLFLSALPLPARAGVTYAVFRTGSLYQPLPERLPVPGVGAAEPARVFGKEWWSGAGMRRDQYSWLSGQALFNYLRVRHRDLSNRDFIDLDKITLANPDGSVLPEIFRSTMIDSISLEAELVLRAPVEFFIQPWIGGGGAYYWVWSNDRVGGVDNRRTNRVAEYRLTLGLDVKTSEKTKLLIGFRRHTMLVSANEDLIVDNFLESILNKNLHYAADKKYPGWEIPKNLQFISVTAALCVGFR